MTWLEDLSAEPLEQSSSKLEEHSWFDTSGVSPLDMILPFCCGGEMWLWLLVSAVVLPSSVLDSICFFILRVGYFDEETAFIETVQSIYFFGS